MADYRSVTVQYTYDSPVTVETLQILAQVAAQGAGVTRVKAWLTGDRSVVCELDGADAPRRAGAPESLRGG